MKFLVLPLLFVACLAEPSFNLDGDKYNFNFATGDSGSHARSESRSSDGAVVGKYSYVDPNGNTREVRYRADAAGFHPEGDVSVDKKTADEAAALAALAPKAPEAPVQIQTYAAHPFTYAAPHPFFYNAPVAAHVPFVGNNFHYRFF